MAKCKASKSVSFPPPTRHEWAKAYTARPKDSLIAHRDSLLKEPFRPSYDQDGDPSMDCLLDWSYGRIWHNEVEEFRMNRARTDREKTAKKKFPIYSARKSKATKEVTQQPCTTNRFQNVSAKVETRRPGALRSKHLIPNLERKCRLCLSDKEIVQSIFQAENSKELTDTLVEKIFECTAIMVGERCCRHTNAALHVPDVLSFRFKLSKDYDFPSPICEDCALKLDEFLLFRTKCLRSNEIYRFNRLHKQRLLFGRKPKDDAAGDKPDTESTASGEEREDVAVPLIQVVPPVAIAEASASSSSDSRTVIETAQNGAVEVITAVEDDLTMASTLHNGATDVEEGSPEQPGQECNGNHRGSSYAREQDQEQHGERLPEWEPPPDPDDSESTGRLSPAPVVLLVDETDSKSACLVRLTTVSETEDVEEVILLPPEEPSAASEDDLPLDDFDGVNFPIETVEDLEHLERLIRTSDTARERYINILRRLKTHDTSLSDTYQRLFADRLLIHYNYDGISPKYNKRPLKTLLLFTDCMAG
uniref:ZAD domain-containing protein n=1 Tax=Anopheles dirus TaxID=7168 RepID=A0A182NBK7_9DIPT